MPENTDDFRELLNEKFKSLQTSIDMSNYSVELKFKTVQTTLNSIEEQVKKTNGRVTKLEEVTQSLILKDATHLLNCPQGNRIKEIENEIENYKTKMNTDLEEYNFFKRYPKIAIGTIAFLVVIMLLGISEVKEHIWPKAPVKVETTK